MQGLPIESYCLEIDRQLTNNFEAVLGCESQLDQMNLDFTVKSLTKGNLYAFRYKARSAYGWGDYSPTALLLVATEPAKPKNAPTFISSTDTDLTIGLDVEAIENNGSQILEYSLEISDDSENFATVPTYNSNAQQHTLNIVADTLDLGKVYSFRMRARNSIGWGEYSTVLINVGLTSLPA